MTGLWGYRIAVLGAGHVGPVIARAAVEAQGGRLWVEDSPLGGARFVLLIQNVVEEQELA